MSVDAASVPFPNDAIAIIGLSVALEDAQSLERFWSDALSGGGSTSPALAPLGSSAAFLSVSRGLQAALNDAGYLHPAANWRRASLVLGLSGAASCALRAAWSPWLAKLFEFDAACTVDAAALSSLSALGLACAELRAGRADLIIAGGCEGAEHALDEDGPAHGYAFFALKRACDALKDRDRVYALIREIGPSAEQPAAHSKRILQPLIECALSVQRGIVLPRAHLSGSTGRLSVGVPSSLQEGSARPWTRAPNGAPRTGVLTVGTNGGSFRVVLEEQPSRTLPISAGASAARAFFWSASTPRALLRSITAERGRFDAPPREAQAPSAHPRLGFVARSSEEYQQLLALAEDELRARLESESFSHPRGVYYRSHGFAADARVTALFAGQGSQYVDMGRDAALQLPPVRRVFEQMNAHFSAAVPLSEVVFTRRAGTSPEALEQQLRRTEYAQPAVGALSWGQYELVREMGFEPDAVIGHSFGELTALCAAGCLSPAGFMALARARGLAMAPPAGSVAWDAGAMAAVSAGERDIAALLIVYPEVRICNYNAPTQVVVGGPIAAIESFVVACDDIGLKAQLLPVAAAFHSPLVRHALESFRHALDVAEMRPPCRDVFSNNGGDAYSGDAEHDRALLTGQLVNAVRFEAQVLGLYRAGHRVFVEFGPKTILTKLVQAILKDRPFECVSFDGGPRKSSALAIQQACVQLKVLGLPLFGLNRWAARPEATGSASITSIRADADRPEAPPLSPPRASVVGLSQLASRGLEARSEARPRLDGAALRAVAIERPQSANPAEKVAVS